ncbi:MAG: endonuclease [Bacteroidota bacterium]|nr:endonuclease [Bacteroidota bacterium]
MKMRRLIISGFVFFISLCFSHAQSLSSLDSLRFRVMFYNTENFFDTRHDSLKNDREFLPGAMRHWTYKRYQNKLNNLYKVIAALGYPQPPEIIGLCEIENDKVLSNLMYDTPLLKYPYKFIHHESPDERGIDVAVLYRTDRFKLLNKRFIRVFFPFKPQRQTREIIYACGLIDGKDTLHLFVNHWPSKSGGEAESRPYRIQTGKILKIAVDSVLAIHPQAKIVIVGDFNDGPDSECLIDGLQAKTSLKNLASSQVYNLSALLQEAKSTGTHKYRGNWEILDQIIVSGKLLIDVKAWHTTLKCAQIFNAPFLLEDDPSDLGQRPVRTYNGFKYHGGFSDHLPVYLDLFRVKSEN